MSKEMKKNKQKKELIKIIYFDEPSASDYNIIKEGGQIDWTSEKNKEKLAKIIGEIEAQAKSGFNFLSYVKAAVSGKMGLNLDYETSSILKSTVTNTILTDYLSHAATDESIEKFEDYSVYAPENSITMYKMYSSYLNIVPKDMIPIDLEGLNNAILGERGYYQMLAERDNSINCIFRFNIKAFKNNYSLVDLSKMNLCYYGVKVGQSKLSDLNIQNEFKFEKNNDTIQSPEEIVKNKMIRDNCTPLDVYDIVLAGVMSKDE